MKKLCLMLANDIKFFKYITILIMTITLSGCGKTESSMSSIEKAPPKESSKTLQTTQAKSSLPDESAVQNIPTLLYMGQASIRIVTEENKVIYIDPYAGDTYDLPADLILVTHEHYDHSNIDKVQNRSKDCEIITHKEAIVNGEHMTFELGYVTVDAVEAGFNDWHDVNECAGYVLTLNNGSSVYVMGDTSKTTQMSDMSDMNIDYAFYCCDGVFNMGLDEAAECARLVGAKHNIPYHNTTDTSGDHFDREKAEQFDVPNRLIIKPGEEIQLTHDDQKTQSNYNCS